MKEAGKLIGLVCIGITEIVTTGIFLAIGFHLGSRIINKISRKCKQL